MDKPAKNRQTQILDSIIGDPPVIGIDLTAGSLYNAFLTAVTVFESSTPMPATFLASVHRTLRERVEKSQQPQAKECLKAFNLHYIDKLGDKPDQNDEIPPLSYTHLPENIRDLFEKAEKSLLAYQAKKDRFNLTAAINNYDNLVKGAYEAEDDDVDEALDAYQAKYEMPIRVMVADSEKLQSASSTSDRHLKK